MAFTISEGMFRTLAQGAAEDWDRQTAEKLLEMYPAHMGALGATVADLSGLCRTVRGHALSYQITERRDVFKLAVIGLSLGAHFCHDPRFQEGIARSLARLSLPSGRRLTLLSTFAEAWLRSLWRGRTLSDFGARLVATLRHCTVMPDSPSALTAALRPLLPDERGILRVEQSETFLAACADHTLAYGLPDPELRLAYCASALAHGYSWFDDPLMRGLRSEFEAARSADDLHARMAGFYARFS